MLTALKRWLRARRGPEPAAADFVAWGRRRGLHPQPLAGGEGWGLAGRLDGHSWRYEWGPPQRNYLLDRELRLRIDLGLPGSLQMLLLSRSLAEELEQAAYALFTQANQTQLDTGMSEEMRWLAMYPEARLPVLRSLRPRFRAVAPATPPLGAWLEGELAGLLGRATRQWLAPDDPFVLMTLRGRVYLRMEARETETERIEAFWQLGEAAARRALQVAGELQSLQDDTVGRASAWMAEGGPASRGDPAADRTGEEPDGPSTR